MASLAETLTKVSNATAIKGDKEATYCRKKAGKAFLWGIAF